MGGGGGVGSGGGVGDGGGVGEGGGAGRMGTMLAGRGEAYDTQQVRGTPPF